MLFQKPRIPIKDVLLYGLLPSFLKVWIYRLKGYRIGRTVSIGFGSVICAGKVTVGERTSIGFFTIIRGKEIAIGSDVNIGAFTFLDTPFIEIGDGSKINEQVYVGGLQFPDSRFVLGRNCQVMQMTFINPARSITVGDDSGIGGHCLIFGHTSWLSQFEGYAVDFEPIAIGNSVSVAWGVFLLPGTKIGDGAVIGAGSMVSRTVPPKCLAIGYPARVVSKYPDFPRDVDDSEKIEMLKSIVTEMIDVFEKEGAQCRQNHNGYEVSRLNASWWKKSQNLGRLEVLYDTVDEGKPVTLDKNIDILLSLWAIPDKMRAACFREKIMWIDIENKEQSDLTNELGDEVVLFLRRYGVRFNRLKEKGKRKTRLGSYEAGKL
jgi:acetyltransferase-like isoleucine patch superfamily enzyme